MKMKLIEQHKKAKYRISGSGFGSIDILKEAIKSLSGEFEPDVYGTGAIIENFENKFAELLGQEAAVFMPSGVMAQLIALRINADEKNCKKVAYHPLSHLEIHEKDAIRALHNLEPILLGQPERLFTLDDLKSMEEEISTLLIELPQREIGGRLPSLSELESIADYAKTKNIKLHMDGARLLETLPYYNKKACEIAAYFDSVYISFYKGIGAIAGAILAGSQDFIEKAKIWKRRHGGDLISLYPYIVSADYCYEKRKNKIQEYYSNAKKLAGLFNGISYAYTVPEVPVTNMFHLYFTKNADEVKKILSIICEESSVSLAGKVLSLEDELSKIEISIGDNYLEIPQNLIEKIILKFKEQ